MLIFQKYKISHNWYNTVIISIIWNIKSSVFHHHKVETGLISSAVSSSDKVSGENIFNCFSRNILNIGIEIADFF